MAAITPILTSALVSQGVGLAVSEFSRRKSQDQSLKQLKKRQDLDQKIAQQNAQLNRERIAIDSRQSEEKRKRALRRAVSRQRANFGAQGIGSGAASSQAVLLGLFDESDEERKRREELDNLRLSSIDQNLSQGASLNVLQRTQLEQRNNLRNLSAIGNRATDLL